MATLILLHRAWSDRPLVAVAVRDELAARPSGHPQFLDPGVFAPVDLVNGGTWFGVNDRGLMAGILPRRHGYSYRPRVAPGTSRSLGLMARDALAYPGVLEAVADLPGRLKPGLQKDFYLVLADADRLALITQERSGISVCPLERNMYVFTEHGYLREHSDRTGLVLDELNKLSFRRRPALKTLFGWTKLHEPDNNWRRSDDSVCQHLQADGTETTAVSVACLAADRRWQFYHRHGRPCCTAQATHHVTVKLR